MEHLLNNCAQFLKTWYIFSEGRHPLRTIMLGKVICSSLWGKTQLCFEGGAGGRGGVDGREGEGRHFYEVLCDFHCNKYLFTWGWGWAGVAKSFQAIVWLWNGKGISPEAGKKRLTMNTCIQASSLLGILPFPVSIILRFLPLFSWLNCCRDTERTAVNMHSRRSWKSYGEEGSHEMFT